MGLPRPDTSGLAMTRQVITQSRKLKNQLLYRIELAARKAELWLLCDFMSVPGVKLMLIFLDIPFLASAKTPSGNVMALLCMPSIIWL
jgi:hypothetical protein